MKYIYPYTKHAIKTLICRTFYTNQEKEISDKKRICGPGKVHSPLSVHCKEASQPLYCTLQEGQPALLLHPAGRLASPFPALCWEASKPILYRSGGQ